jgi:hypothetical protein
MKVSLRENNVHAGLYIVLPIPPHSSGPFCALLYPSAAFHVLLLVTGGCVFATVYSITKLTQ